MTLRDKKEEDEQQVKTKAELLGKTEVTQPAILLHSYLNYLKVKDKLTSEYDIVYLFGPSLGEIIALVIGNSISLVDAGEMLYKRGSYMQQSCPIGIGIND